MSSLSDVTDIRRKLREISELSNEEKRIATSYSSQVDSLRKDLVLVTKQIEFEQERRQDVERTLESELRENITGEHFETIRRREDDIRQIREEKAAMMEWLQRGVAEAQRITMQIEHLKTSQEQSRATEAEYTEDRQRLSELQERLGEEITAAKTKAKQLTDQRDSLEVHADQQKSTLAVTEEILKTTLSDNTKITTDLEDVRSRARDLETVEIATSCISAAVRRALHELEVVQQGITSGGFSEEEDEYDSGDDPEPTTYSPIVLSSTKAKVGRCDALMSTLWSLMKRFDQDASARNASLTARHNLQVANLRSELETTKGQLSGELQQLRDETAIREPQLRSFIEMRAEASRKHAEFNMLDDVPEHNTFDLINHIEEETAVIRDKVINLRSENVRLTDKVAKLEGDYSAVRQLKHEYRDLEAERTVLSQSIRSEEVVNKEMKYLMFEHNSRSGVTPKKETRGTPKQPWRSTIQN